VGEAAEIFDGRVVLHCLPPYCPHDNKIERCVWRELHPNVTCDHKCQDVGECCPKSSGTGGIAGRFILGGTEILDIGLNLQLICS